MYVFCNLNPLARTTSDCAIRACAMATNLDWDKTYDEICYLGRMMGEMPDNGAVWGAYLRRHGFKRYIMDNTCPECYTIREFVNEHPKGCYVIAIFGNPGHVVTAIDGDYYDIYDCGDEIPTFYYTK